MADAVPLRDLTAAPLTSHPNAPNLRVGLVDAACAPPFCGKREQNSRDDAAERSN